MLLGTSKEIQEASQKYGFPIDGIEIIDPLQYPEIDSMVARLVELRKGKMTEKECREILKKTKLFRYDAGENRIRRRTSWEGQHTQPPIPFARRFRS